MEVRIDQENVKRMKRSYRNQKRKKKIRIVVIISLIFITTIGLVFLKTRNKNNNNSISNKELKKITATLIGKWTTDGNTVYEFQDNSKGNLIVPVMTLPFTYTLENNTIFIDFENEDSKDIKYTYWLEENKLTITGENGTFEFMRVEE